MLKTTLISAMALLGVVAINADAMTTEWKVPMSWWDWNGWMFYFVGGFLCAGTLIILFIFFCADPIIERVEVRIRKIRKWLR